MDGRVIKETLRKGSDRDKGRGPWEENPNAWSEVKGAASGIHKTPNQGTGGASETNNGNSYSPEEEEAVLARIRFIGYID